MAVYPPLLEPGHPWAADALVLTAPASPPNLRPLVAPEGSTLVLHPSPSRMARLAAALRDDGRDVAVFGSERSTAELTLAWVRARAGACVVIGGRTAAWAPVPDLATVIIVDEIDEAFDEERAPTWNARDVGVERARRAGATVRMITPAPSIEAHLVLGDPLAPSRPRWPRVEVVDVRDQEPGQALITRELADALRPRRRHRWARGVRAQPEGPRPTPRVPELPRARSL